MRFFYFSLNDTAAAGLSALSRTWSSGSGDAALWLQEKSQSYSWQRAEVTFSSSSNSKVSEETERGLWEIKVHLSHVTTAVPDSETVSSFIVTVQSTVGGS